MNRILLIAFAACLILISCDSDSEYKIQTTSVGNLTNDTPVNELKTIFKNDSVVDGNSGERIQNSGGAIEIYEKKSGKQLLSLVPNTSAPDSKIRNVQIFDPRYETPEGISLNSTFGDINNAYKISKIETLISSVVVFVDDINAYFTIDKKDLPSTLQFDYSAKIEAHQIPDGANIKYFMIGW